MAENQNKWFMAGTEGTGEYIVLGTSPMGRVGVRNLNDEYFRVRIEPNGLNTMLIGIALSMTPIAWKQPDEYQERFSAVVSKKNLTKTLKTGVAILRNPLFGELALRPENLEMPDWLAEICDEVKLVLRPDYALIETLRTISEGLSHEETMAMAKAGANGNGQTVHKKLIDLSVQCDNLLEDMGVQAQPSL